MLGRFEETLEQAASETNKDLKDIDIEEIITIASMIERKRF